MSWGKGTHRLILWLTFGGWLKKFLPLSLLHSGNIERALYGTAAVLGAEHIAGNPVGLDVRSLLGLL